MSASTSSEPLGGSNAGSPDITVFRGWDEPGHYVWSPYVAKLETRLRFAGVRYGIAAGSVKSGPKGKIPYVECSPASTDAATAGNQKITLGDSALIIKSLVDWDAIPDLNAALSPRDRATDLALRALLEEKLAFYHVSTCRPITRSRRRRN